MEEARDSGPDFWSGFAEMGSEQKQKENNRGEVDTSAPFESVKEAVTRFGGIGFWKPHTRKPYEASEKPVVEEVEDLAKERGILKEIEATKTTVKEIKGKLQKEAVNDQDNNGGSKKSLNEEEANVQVDEVEILNRVKEATEEVKSCTRVLEDVLSRVEAARRNPTSGNVTMSIGEILSKKLALAEECSEKSSIKWKVSLAQILRKNNNGEKRGSGGGGVCGGGDGGIPTKRRKHGFGGMSFLVATPGTKTKKQDRL